MPDFRLAWVHIGVLPVLFTRLRNQGRPEIEAEKRLPFGERKSIRRLAMPRVAIEE